MMVEASGGSREVSLGQMPPPNVCGDPLYGAPFDKNARPFWSLSK